MGVHNKTTPYLALKKISLKIWTLRDQLEMLLESNIHYNQLEKVPELIHHFNESGLMAEYFNDPEAIKIIKEKGLALRPEIEEGRFSLGTMFLTDIGMSGMLFFSRSAFLPGQSVLIEFQIPQHFIVTAQIVQCGNYNLSSRVISTERPKFRLQAQFSFQRKGERTLLRQFLQSVSPIPGQQPKANETAEEAAQEIAGETPVAAAGGEEIEWPTDMGGGANAAVDSETASANAGTGDGGVEDLLKNLAA